jgi:hypothetical protein
LTTPSTTADAATLRAGHPLLKVFDRKMSGWDTWLHLWNGADFTEQRIGLLHSGFELYLKDPREQAQRLAFYLEVADGHLMPSEAFRAPRESAVGYQDPLDAPSEQFRRQFVRSELARTAFSLVVRRFLRPGHRQSTVSIDWAVITQPEAFYAILRFFRVDPDRECLVNLGSQPGSAFDERLWHKSAAFIRDFCTYGWGRSGFSNALNLLPDAELTVENMAALERFRKARPEMIEMMIASGQGRHLIQDAGYYQFDTPCWEKLKEWALRPLSVPNVPELGEIEMRKPVTVNQALAHGSYPAQILLLRRIRQLELANIPVDIEASAAQSEINEPERMTR